MKLALIIAGGMAFLILIRKLYFRYPAFAIPATLGAGAGLGLGIYVVNRSGVSSPASILLPLTMALGLGFSLGGACKNWCDQTFGKGKKGQVRD